MQTKRGLFAVAIIVIIVGVTFVALYNSNLLFQKTAQPTVTVVLSPSSQFVTGQQNYVNGLAVSPLQTLTSPIEVTITGEENYPCKLTLSTFYQIMLYNSGLPESDVSTQIQGSVEYSADSANLLPNFSNSNSNTWTLPNIAYLPPANYYVTITDSKGFSTNSNTISIQVR